MAILSIDNLEAGMVLKSAVCDRSGRLLLPAGVELAAKHLKIFLTWGVSEADIEGDEIIADDLGASGDTGNDPLALAEAQHVIEQLFIHNDPQHPLIHELKRICVARRMSGAP